MDISKEFTFESDTVKVRVVGTTHEPLFVAVDVCRALELENPTRAVECVDEDDLTLAQVIDSLGREQTVNVLTESGLYTLILRSEKPKAKLFRRWVTKVVLPAIRENGFYSVEGTPRRLSVQEQIDALSVLKTGAAQIEWMERNMPLEEMVRPFQERLALEETANLDHFWQSLVDAFRGGAFGCSRAQYTRFFKISNRRTLYPPGRPNQGQWTSHNLYFGPGPVLEIVNTWTSKTYVWNRPDIRKALARAVYYIPGEIKQKLGGDNSVCVWGVELDLHPLGYRAVTDEELAQAQAAVTDGAWKDPRLGPLYEIVRAMEHPEFAA